MISVSDQWDGISKQIVERTMTATKEAINDAAKEGAKYLRNNSPKASHSRQAGRYARGWRANLATANSLFAEAYVYNQTDWQLTHLLEDGHDIKNRFGGNRVLGHYGGTKHIYYAEGHVYDILGQKIMIRFSRGLK